MRFQQTLLLQKQQVEEMNRRDETEQVLAPIKETINKQYVSVRTWVNPMALSLERVKHKQIATNSSAIPNTNAAPNPMNTNASPSSLQQQSQSQLPQQVRQKNIPNNNSILYPSTLDSKNRKGNS